MHGREILQSGNLRETSPKIKIKGSEEAVKLIGDTILVVLAISPVISSPASTRSTILLPSLCYVSYCERLPNVD